MSKRIISALATALTLVLTVATALAAPHPSSPLIARAKAMIAERMVDPSSLQYRNVRIVNATVQGKSFTIACGEYNAKNKMGGYTGYRTFAFEPTALNGVMSFDGSSFDYFTPDGQDKGSPDFGNEINARILAVCLGLKQ